MKILQTIVRPLTTEKSSNAQASGHYTFHVNMNATKTDIKRAILEMYGVEAKDVRSMRVPAKTRAIARGKVWKKRSGYKKVIVTIKEGKKFDPNKIKLKEPKNK